MMLYSGLRNTLLVSGCLLSQVALANTQRTEHFVADTVSIEKMRANVEVTIAEQADVDVFIEGEEEFVNNVRINLSGSRLEIAGGKTQRPNSVSVTTVGTSGSNHSVVTINGNTTVAKGNGVVILGKSSTSVPEIKIALPSGTALELSNFKGSAKIGDLNGPLTVNSAADIDAGIVTNTVVTAEKNADINIAGVLNQLNVDLKGNAKLRVDTGNVSYLLANASGNSEFNFGGHAEEANLSARGNAEIHARYVRAKPAIALARNAEIRVGNW